MADEKQLKVLRSGVEAWNEWREKNREDRLDLQLAHLASADLSNANLSGADLSRANLLNANLSDADLHRANFSNANLRAANLRNTNLRDAALIRSVLIRADLRGANLRGAIRGANLRGADLRYANLSGTSLRGANLRGANLGSADLRSADLHGTNFSNASLTDANLSGARIGYASLANLDLSATKGMAEVDHSYPSGLATSTLEITAAGLAKDASRQAGIETFLRGAGVEDHWIEYFRSRIGQPIEFYSCFISYSHSDKPFARRLYADLQAAGIRCWLDEKDMRAGDVILDAVNQAIRRHDKLILCCSLASLSSPWVEKELASAFDREDRFGERILIPVDLDGYLRDGYEGRFGPQIRERLAVRLRGWKNDADLYDTGLEAVKNALRPQ